MNTIKSNVCIILIVVCFSACQNEKTIEDRIIDKAIQAFGGEDNLRSIKSKKEIGTTIIYLQDTLFRTSRHQQFFKSPDKNYYKSPINKPQISPKLVFASNGTILWTQNDGAYAPYL